MSSEMARCVHNYSQAVVEYEKQVRSLLTWKKEMNAANKQFEMNSMAYGPSQRDLNSSQGYKVTYQMLVIVFLQAADAVVKTARELQLEPSVSDTNRAKAVNSLLLVPRLATWRNVNSATYRYESSLEKLVELRTSQLNTSEHRMNIRIAETDYTHWTQVMAGLKRVVSDSMGSASSQLMFVL